MLTGMLTTAAVQLVPFAQPTPALAAAYVAPPAGDVGARPTLQTTCRAKLCWNWRLFGGGLSKLHQLGTSCGGVFTAHMGITQRLPSNS